jgi:hypothetical protein
LGERYLEPIQVSITCNVCRTELRWDFIVTPCPTCARHKFMEERLLENMEVMKEIRTLLKELVTIIGENRYGKNQASE